MLNNVAEIVDRYTAEMVAEMITALKNGGSKSLYNEIDYEVQKDIEFIESLIIMPSYAYYASEGRKPGRLPPLQDIRDWADKRGIDQAAVYPIAQKIAAVGTKSSATHFLEEFKLTTEFEDEVLGAFMEDVKQQIIDMTKKNKNVQVI